MATIVPVAVNCPYCGKTVPWIKTQVNKPFCSERCKLIDLGKWANEDHFIPGSEVDPLTMEKVGDE